MKSSFIIGLMKLTVILVLTVCISSCLSVISEEITECFKQETPIYSFSFEEPQSDRFVFIESLLIDTDAQTVTVNEKEVHLSTVEYRMIEKICKKISETYHDLNFYGGNN